MSGGGAVQPGGGGPAGAAVASGRLERTQWRQLAIITAAAVGIFFGMRALPTGTNLSHMDFRVDPKAGKGIEFCDPSNPQFIPVVAVKSPVVMTVATAAPARAGQPVHGTVTLKTASGKPVGAEDLLYTHTRKMHLLIVDESLTDYQHVHPDPAAARGEWQFAFTPHHFGGYRVFADFMPAATSRGLYASVDLPVAAGDGVAASADGGARNGTAKLPLAGARSYETETRNSKPETAAVPLAGARSYETESRNSKPETTAVPLAGARSHETETRNSKPETTAVPLAGARSHETESRNSKPETTAVPLAGARSYETETRNGKPETTVVPLAGARGHEALAGARGHDALAGARSRQSAVERDGYRFALTPATPPIHAGRAAELSLEVTRVDGGAVPLEPVMDALAHLVAFDTKRSGFAHLHPVESDVDRTAGPTRPVLRFRLMIPAAGPYVIWAQVNLAGREMFVPFWFDVVSASGGNQD